jgi:hypothetical protein
MARSEEVWTEAQLGGNRRCALPTSYTFSKGLTFSFFNLTYFADCRVVVGTQYSFIKLSSISKSLFLKC